MQQYKILCLLDEACRYSDIPDLSLTCAGFSGKCFEQASIFEIKAEDQPVPEHEVFSYHRSAVSSGNNGVALEYAYDQDVDAALLVSHGMGGRPDYRTHNQAKELQARTALHLLLHPYQQHVEADAQTHGRSPTQCGNVFTQAAYRRAYAAAGLSTLLDDDEVPAGNSGLFEDYWLQVSLAGAINDLAARQDAIWMKRR